MINRLFSLIGAYKFTFIKILLYEIYYILRGFKGNTINIRKNQKYNSNIPCPYFFLVKIEKFLKENNLKYFIDLGCGGGRVIYFLNIKYKINYCGIEYFQETYFKCEKLFRNQKNVMILNDNFMTFNFLEQNNDCYFLNDPLKDEEEFNKLIFKIIEKNKLSNKLVYFIVINVDENKLKIFNKYECIEYLKINTRGLFIYSNKQKIMDEV